MKLIDLKYTVTIRVGVDDGTTEKDVDTGHIASSIHRGISRQYNDEGLTSPDGHEVTKDFSVAFVRGVSE